MDAWRSLCRGPCGVVDESSEFTPPVTLKDNRRSWNGVIGTSVSFLLNENLLHSLFFWQQRERKALKPRPTGRNAIGSSRVRALPLSCLNLNLQIDESVSSARLIEANGIELTIQISKEQRIVVYPTLLQSFTYGLVTRAIPMLQSVHHCFGTDLSMV